MIDGGSFSTSASALHHTWLSNNKAKPAPGDFVDWLKSRSHKGDISFKEKNGRVWVKTQSQRPRPLKLSKTKLELSEYQLTRINKALDYLHKKFISPPSHATRNAKARHKPGVCPSSLRFRWAHIDLPVRIPHCTVSTGAVTGKNMPESRYIVHVYVIPAHYRQQTLTLFLSPLIWL